MFKLDLEKAGEPGQHPLIIEKAREFQKIIYSEYAKDIDCVDQSKLRKTLQEIGILDDPT